MKRLIISGAGSHSGKTTITCGLLSSLRAKGFKVCAYKTGPDYIDPEYLRMAGGCEVYNLDTWLMSEARTLELFEKTSRGHDIAIIEGAMALHDGGNNSTAQIAKLLRAPVVLVIDAKSVGESAAAVALGFREYDRDVNLAGVILNRAGSDYHVKIIAECLERVGIKLLGALGRDDGFAVPERHLGLVSAHEWSGLNVERLRKLVDESVDVEEVVRLAESGRLDASVSAVEPVSNHVRIGVARDDAFTFYYPESLRTLQELGAELVYFSPLSDECLPDADGYIFGGGFPEMFAEALSRNTSMLGSVRANTRPVLAECGGLMYLCRSLTDIEGHIHGMAGVVPLSSVMTGRVTLGYMEAECLKDNILCEAGAHIRGHEFHYSQIAPAVPDDFCAFKLTRRNTNSSHFDGYAHKNILASYLHINMFGYPQTAQRFINSCIA